MAYRHYCESVFLYKTLTAVTALQLVEEGKLELDVPVARYWPEFAAAGKESITLRQLLSHRAGLPALRELMPPAALYEWQTMVDALAAEAPLVDAWRRSRLCRDHLWLAGGRVDSSCRRSQCRSVDHGAHSPAAGLDFHVGLADEESFTGVAHIARSKGTMGDAAAQRLLKAMMNEPTSMSTRAFTNPPSIMTSTNKPEWRRMEQPAANGHGNAVAWLVSIVVCSMAACSKPRCLSN